MLNDRVFEVMVVIAVWASCYTPATVSCDASPNAATAPSKLAPPTATDQQRASQLVHDVYRDELAAARQPSQKDELAQKLLKLGTSEKHDPVQRFVLLSLARDMACEAGDVEIAFGAVEDIDQEFDIDGLKLKTDAAYAALHHLSPDARKSFVTAARPIFCFIDPIIRPDKTLEVFAFEDDYSFGVIQSSLHTQWFWAKCSNFKSDPRYTPESVFDTFPWPQSPTAKQIEAVAAAAVEVRRVRAEALKVTTGGLRAVYRTLELPGRHPLKDAHAALDAAVLAAYGFDAKKDLLAQLLELNLTVAALEKQGKPVTAPGIPPTYPNPQKLVTNDCIRP